jgi:hypothetical protein
MIMPMNNNKISLTMAPVMFGNKKKTKTKYYGIKNVFNMIIQTTKESFGYNVSNILICMFHNFYIVRRAKKLYTKFVNVY